MKNSNVVIDKHNYAKSPLDHSNHKVQFQVSSSLNKMSLNNERTCIFTRDTTGYGFKITGNAPVKVKGVRENGSAWNAGLRENDAILQINGINVRTKQHAEVVALIRKQESVELLVRADDVPLSPQLSQIPYSKTTQPKSLSLESDNRSSRPVNPRPRPRTIPNIVENNVKHTSLPKPPDTNSLTSNKTSQSELYSSGNSTGSFSSTSSESDTEAESSVKKPSVPLSEEPTTHFKSHSYNVPKPQYEAKEKPKIKPKPNRTTEDIHINSVFSKSPPKLNHDFEKPMRSDFSTLPRKHKMMEPEQPSPQRLDNIPNSHLLPGRDFEDDMKDDEDSDVIDMLYNLKDALYKPAYTALLVSYAKDEPENLKQILLYFSCKMYQSVYQRVDFKAESPRMANEIVTTFTLEKSPLYVHMNPDLVFDMKMKLQTGQDTDKIFDPLVSVLLEQMGKYSANIAEKIKIGTVISTEHHIIKNLENRDMEMNFLHKTLCNILSKINKTSTLSDYDLALQVGIATLFNYFYKPVTMQSMRMKARSQDSLVAVGNQGKIQSIAEMFKFNVFCSAYQSKQSSIRRQKKNILNHILMDTACVFPEYCYLCDGLLFGPSPQGCRCSQCAAVFHFSCARKLKSFPKKECTKKLRKSASQVSNKDDKNQSTFFSRLSRKSSTSSVKGANVSGDVNTSPSTVNTTANGIGNQIFGNGTMSPDEKTIGYGAHDDNDSHSHKFQSEDNLNRLPSLTGRFERTGSAFDLSSKDRNNVVKELVPDEGDNDPDMKVNESFDAGEEMQSIFPSLEPTAEKKRIIVLLEFYHKTRYILMNLKMFHYKMVLKWPEIHKEYCKALGIDCIVPFVQLIDSLVKEIKQCISEQDFINLENAVYNWLSIDDDRHIKTWMELSSNLVCTNSLNIIKNLKQTTLTTIPELSDIVKTKMHKVLIIEELSQIRPLLISLPLIVKNIIKCLTKMDPLYADELTVWKKVSVKMDYLCEYIDRCCIPLVELINNGIIIRSRVDWPTKIKESDTGIDFKEYCSEFPRTIFLYPIFDFQLAKIFSWSTNTVETQSKYLKKGAEVLLIFYKTFIIILQKENEHYVLKPVKPITPTGVKQFPVLEIGDVLVKSGGQEEDCHILNIIIHKVNYGLLIRIGFSHQEIVENWLDFLNNKRHNLGRSISTLKLRDIKTYNPPASPHPSDRVNLRESVDSVDSNQGHEAQIEPSPTLKIESIPENSMTENPVFMTLSENLNKAADALNLNESLSQLLNLGESDASVLNAIGNPTMISAKESAFVSYHFARAAIDYAAQCINNTKPNLDYLKNLFDLLTHSENQRFQESPRREHQEIPKSSAMKINDIPLPKLAEDSEICNKKNSSDDILDDVKEIVEEIINDVVDRINNDTINNLQTTYKYVPSNLKSPTDNANNSLRKSQVIIRPTFTHLNSPIEEVVTISRAQFIPKCRVSQNIS